jgi:hypothetical protein
MSEFLKAIAFGLFLGLSTELGIIMIWSAEVTFGQLLWTM